MNFGQPGLLMFLILPNDIIGEIFGLLPYFDQVALAQTCKRIVDIWLPNRKKYNHTYKIKQTTRPVCGKFINNFSIVEVKAKDNRFWQRFGWAREEHSVIIDSCVICYENYIIRINLLRPEHFRVSIKIQPPDTKITQYLDLAYPFGVRARRRNRKSPEIRKKRAENLKFIKLLLIDLEQKYFRGHQWIKNLFVVFGLPGYRRNMYDLCPKPLFFGYFGATSGRAGHRKLFFLKMGNSSDSRTAFANFFRANIVF